MFKLAQEIVVLGKPTLTLEGLDKDSGLIVSSSREDLRFASRNDRVAGNELCEDRPWSEKIHVELFKLGAGQSFGEIIAFFEAQILCWLESVRLAFSTSRFSLEPSMIWFVDLVA